MVCLCPYTELFGFRIPRLLRQSRGVHAGCLEDQPSFALCPDASCCAGRLLFQSVGGRCLVEKVFQWCCRNNGRKKTIAWYHFGKLTKQRQNRTNKQIAETDRKNKKNKKNKKKQKAKSKKQKKKKNNKKKKQKKRKKKKNHHHNNHNNNHHDQQQPTTTNNNQQQPTTTKNNQQQPATTNKNQTNYPWNSCIRFPVRLREFPGLVCESPSSVQCPYFLRVPFGDIMGHYFSDS